MVISLDGSINLQLSLNRTLIRRLAEDSKPFRMLEFGISKENGKGLSEKQTLLLHGERMVVELTFILLSKLVSLSLRTNSAKLWECTLKDYLRSPESS